MKLGYRSSWLLVFVVSLIWVGCQQPVGFSDPTQTPEPWWKLPYEICFETFSTDVLTALGKRLASTDITSLDEEQREQVFIDAANEVGFDAAPHFEVFEGDGETILFAGDWCANAPAPGMRIYIADSRGNVFLVDNTSEPPYVWDAEQIGEYTWAIIRGLPYGGMYGMYIQLVGKSTYDWRIIYDSLQGKGDDHVPLIFKGPPSNPPQFTFEDVDFLPQMMTVTWYEPPCWDMIESTYEWDNTRGFVLVEETMLQDVQCDAH